MNLHPLLTRQLIKLGLASEKAPTLEEWNLVLQRVSDKYLESDQDRYLIERSLDISSREMQELNEKLENAQHLVGLGYWFYSIIDERIIWTKETYLLFDYDPLEPAPTYEEFMLRVHPEDKLTLTEAVEKAINNKTAYEVEIRYLFKPDNHIRWFRCIGKPTPPKNPEQKAEILTGVALDITRQKEVEAQIRVLNEQLLASARQAGMSEVATAVLHNIGNVLNSVNVSVEIAEENLVHLEFEKIKELAVMINDHKDDLTQFIKNDSKGKLITHFIDVYANDAIKLHQTVTHELHALVEHIRHIKEIITTQQAYAGVYGKTEKLKVADAINAALQITGSTKGKQDVLIEKNYDDAISVFADKSKLYQILVNLIQNAKESVLSSSSPDKKIILRVNEVDEDNVSIIVEDNGTGILKENLTRIFAFGFTSKKTGHGIGLHSCALAAKEMGGSLTAKSDGVNAGAIFTLTLPMIAPNRES